MPCHAQPAMADVDWRAAGGLTVTEQPPATASSLPLYPELAEAQVERVSAAVAAGVVASLNAS